MCFSKHNGKERRKSMSEVLNEKFTISDDESLTSVAATYDETPKYQGNTIINDTSQWVIGQCFFEGRDTNGNLPAGFQSRTGVTVGGLDVFPNRRNDTQVQSQVKVQANKVECGLTNLVNQRTGRRISQWRFPDKIASAGHFFRRTTFGIKDRNASATDDSIEFYAEYLLDDYTVEIEYFKMK